MAKKFKIGDRFKVVRRVGKEDFNDGWKIGTEGTIIGYAGDVDERYPWQAEAPGCWTGYFRASEVEKLRKQVKP